MFYILTRFFPYTQKDLGFTSESILPSSMKYRKTLFENYTVKSMESLRGNFTWLIWTSPHWKDYLDSLNLKNAIFLTDSLPPIPSFKTQREQQLYVEYTISNEIFMHYLLDHESGNIIWTCVIDDDDALHFDFITVMKTDHFGLTIPESFLMYSIPQNETYWCYNKVNVSGIMCGICNKNSKTAHGICHSSIRTKIIYNKYHPIYKQYPDPLFLRTLHKMHVVGNRNLDHYKNDKRFPVMENILSSTWKSLFGISPMPHGYDDNENG